MIFKLSFKGHINNLCKKARQKLNTLARNAPYVCLKKSKVVMKVFATFHLNTVP